MFIFNMLKFDHFALKKRKRKRLILGFPLRILTCHGEASKIVFRPSLKTVLMRFLAASCRLCRLLNKIPKQHTGRDFSDQQSHVKLVITKTFYCLIMWNLMKTLTDLGREQ